MNEDLEYQFKALNEHMDDMEDRLGAELLVLIRRCEELLRDLPHQKASNP